MTPETRKTLLGLISEYGHSLTRIQAEKELLKMIEQRAVVECAAAAKAFRLYANAHWRDSVPATQEELEENLALFDTVRAVNAAKDEFPDAA